MDNVNILRTGFMAPDFSLLTSQGEIFNLKNHLGDGFLCLCFFADSRDDHILGYLKNLNGDLPLTASGLKMRKEAISPDKATRLDELRNSLKLTFPILSDRRFSVSKRFGVVDSLSPKPAVHFSVFVIDEEGIIRYRQSEIKGISKFNFDQFKEAMSKLI